MAAFPREFLTVIINGYVRSRGARPWVGNVDSIDVYASGATVIDIPVDPFFIIKNESFTKSGSSITGTFTIQSVNNSRTSRLSEFLSIELILDQNNNAANLTRGLPFDMSVPITLSVPIPITIASENSVYTRIGVKITGINELMYSPSYKIQLKWSLGIFD